MNFVPIIFADVLGTQQPQYYGPTWVQIILVVAAVIVASGILWKKLIKPIAKLVTLLDTVLPLLTELASEFHETPKPFKILKDIIGQFRTNGGSSLRDVINRLEAAAKVSQASSRVLAENAEVARKLAAQDREQLSELIVSLNMVRAGQRENAKSVDRMEREDRVVAQNLDASQKRAEQAVSNKDASAGEAADAASLPLPKSDQ